MIKTLSLKFGATGNAPGLRLDPLRTTVFVGPNNSGKSLLLREIQSYIEGNRSSTQKILGKIQPMYPDPATAETMLDSRISSSKSQTKLEKGNVLVQAIDPSKPIPRYLQLSRVPMMEFIRSNWHAQESGADGTDAEDVWIGVFSHFVALFTIALDGKTRFTLAEPRDAGDLLLTPTNHLAALFTDDPARARVRDITADALGLFFTIDPTQLGKLKIRMSSRAPADTAEEQALDERAREFHAAATDIAELSDGIKAFTGIVSALISSDYRVILIDEPEAFLHPSLARKLGSVSAQLASERSANIFASTHSAHFLMGCIESGAPLNIVRLTYQGRKPTARVLLHEKLAILMKDPLLRSTRVLDALFHSSAVVCEGDRDRAFYEEINLRLAVAAKTSVADGLFLNAQNKQTIHRVTQPLREMGIPAAAVVDFDILKGQDLKRLLNACFVPSAEIHSLTILRGDLDAKLGETGERNWRISLLAGPDREACDSLLKQLRKFGIFVVPDGAVEAWLPSVVSGASKESWLVSVFDQMGSDPKAAGYVQPTEGDVWEFVSGIAKWVADPQRRGMPSS